MLSLCLTICLGMVSTTKDSTRSKGVPELSSELYSKTWVPVMDHIVRQAKLSVLDCLCPWHILAYNFQTVHILIDRYMLYYLESSRKKH